MSHRKPLVAIVVASVAFSSLAFVGRVLAAAPTTCTSDAECSKGFTCQPWAVSGGTAPACPANAPDCAVTNTPGVDTGGAGGGAGSSGSSGAGGVTGTDVGAGNVSGTTPATTVISMCEPGPCHTDSDCGPDMVCHGESYTECSGTGSTAPPCEAGKTCDGTPVTTAMVCTTKTTSFCAFHWQLPCNAAADCGAGFTCQPQISGACSGGTPVSGGSGPGIGGTTGTSDPTSPPDNCTTTMSFPGSCQPVATTCTVDADCPANWVCQDVAKTAPRGGASGVGGDSGSGDGASGTATGAGAASGSGVVAGGNTASGRMCSSPFIPPSKASDGGAGGRVGGGEGTGTPTSGSNPPGTGGTTAGPGKDNTGAGAANGAAHVADASGASNDAGGCSVSGSGAAGSRVAGGLSMLALLGLGVVARRRRR